MNQRGRHRHVDPRPRATAIKSVSYFRVTSGQCCEMRFLRSFEGRVERLRPGMPRCTVQQCAD